MVVFGEVMAHHPLSFTLYWEVMAPNFLSFTLHWTEAYNELLYHRLFFIESLIKLQKTFQQCS